MTGKAWVETIPWRIGTKANYRVVPKLMVRLMGLFMPTMKESVEMLYQCNRDYIFDSSKFENAFNYRPTSYEEGINEILATDYKQATDKST